MLLDFDYKLIFNLQVNSLDFATGVDPDQTAPLSNYGSKSISDDTVGNLINFSGRRADLIRN